MGGTSSYGSTTDSIGDVTLGRWPCLEGVRSWRDRGKAVEQQQSQKCTHTTVASDDVGIAKAIALGRFHQTPKHLEDDYCLDSKVLGTGRHGVTRLARCKQALPQSTKRFAVKEVCFTADCSTEMVKRIRSEASTHLQLDHPHIARLFDVYETASSIQLVMECVDGGELLQHLEEREALAEPETADVVSQILLALNYIHLSGFIHCDLKLENVMLDHGSQRVKIIDFGSSQRSNTHGKMQHCSGCLPYTAPEMLAGNCTSKCDIWSLGVITFALLSGHMPFSGPPSAQRQKIIQNKYAMAGDRWRTVSTMGKHFVKSLLEAVPEKRPSAQEALEHTWLLQQRRTAQRLQVDQPMVEKIPSFSKASSHHCSYTQVMAGCLSDQFVLHEFQNCLTLDYHLLQKGVGC